jgi:hypothetical protein
MLQRLHNQHLVEIVHIDLYILYDNEIELVQFIASEMQKEGLDLNNEDNLDSYLNTKFM